MLGELCITGRFYKAFVKLQHALAVVGTVRGSCLHVRSPAIEAVSFFDAIGE